MSMSNQLQVQRVQAEADRSCCRIYPGCQPGRKSMSSQQLRELLQQELPAAELRRRRNHPAEQEPAELR
jgi:hypothetical protein